MNNNRITNPNNKEVREYKSRTTDITMEYAKKNQMLYHGHNHPNGIIFPSKPTQDGGNDMDFIQEAKKINNKNFVSEIYVKNRYRQYDGNNKERKSNWIDLKKKNTSK
ncbi:MAG: hypothetical protein PHD62_05775 [Bacteroidales bacterium]|nr:hypothetical protein [Bacteroidales bacterium]